MAPEAEPEPKAMPRAGKAHWVGSILPVAISKPRQPGWPPPHLFMPPEAKPEPKAMAKDHCVGPILPAPKPNAKPRQPDWPPPHFFMPPEAEPEPKARPKSRWVGPIMPGLKPGAKPRQPDGPPPHLKGNGKGEHRAAPYEVGIAEGEQPNDFDEATIFQMLLKATDQQDPIP